MAAIDNYYAIASAESHERARQLARHAAMQRGCCCAVRRNRVGRFLVIAYQPPPARALLNIAITASLVDPDAPLNQLQQLCLNEGLSNTGWRFVSTHGKASFAAALQPILSAGAQFRNALRLIEWQAQAGLDEPLPEPLAEYFVVTMGMVVPAESQTYCALARLVVPHWRQLAPTMRIGFAQREWVDILLWLQSEQPTIDKNQWRAGWGAISRQFERYRLSSLEKPAWQFAIGEIETGQWQVRPLDAPAKLVEDGMAMRHCVATYVDRCGAGTYRVFSVQNAQTAKPVATIGLELEDGVWCLDQVQGKFNNKVAPDIRQLAEQVANRYNSAAFALQNATHAPPLCVQRRVA